jgi:hypothetical protein
VQPGEHDGRLHGSTPERSAVLALRSGLTKCRSLSQEADDQAGDAAVDETDQEAEDRNTATCSARIRDGERLPIAISTVINTISMQTLTHVSFMKKAAIPG